MTDEKRDLELDLEPSLYSKGAPLELLVPVHVDNFGLALASGYIGGSLKKDAAQDLQSGPGDDLIGFMEAAPSWAIAQGEEGDRVLLSVIREGGGHTEPESLARIPGPLKITEIQAALFKDQASLENFAASYDAFPDVATGIVKYETRWPVKDEPEPRSVLEQRSPHQDSRREELDFFGGFSVGLVEVLSGGMFDEEICNFLQDPGSSVAENAESLLIALEPRSSKLDMEIWSAAMEALRSRFGKKGFDRRDFLTDVEGRLTGRGPEAESWVRGCQKVIEAEIDIPSLADSEKIGRRAALAIILSHEPAGLEDLEDSLEAGSRVRALVAVAVYAFAGLSRAIGKLKSPSQRLAGVLEIGESLAAGKPLLIDVETNRIASDLARHQQVKIGGVTAIERVVEPPPYMVMLKARIQEAGYKVELDAKTGQIGIRPGSAKGEFIVVEDCPRSTPGNPIVNLILPLSTLGARPTIASLKKFMSGAWDYATTVAIREIEGVEEVVSMASLPLATLDRDELNFHVERLLLVSADLGGKKKKGRRVKKAGT